VRLKKYRQPDVNPQDVSRLELLLVHKTSKPVFTPEEDNTVSHEINKAIRMSSQWTDVREAILGAEVLSPSNAAFALYRLGCIAAFDSRKRRNDLKTSELVPTISDLAMSKVELMDPASLVLLLDGYARLQHIPTNRELTKISGLVRQNVAAMNARQLPLVLWAFATLNFSPGSQTLVALEHAVSSRASELSPQGITLVLGGFHAAQHSLRQLTLERLSDVMQRQLLLFKPSELASCLKALASMGHRPTPDFVRAVAGRTGQTPGSRSLECFATVP
jgi:hypothetical protein